MIEEIKHISSLPFFFILGRPRSGTTLLMTILDAHTKTTILIEMPIISDLFQKYGEKTVWSKRELEDFLKDLFNESFSDSYTFNDLPFDKEKIRELILNCEGEIDFQTLIKIIYYNYKSYFPKDTIEILGDKNPSSSREIKLYLDAFPDSKFICIRRDYRDHALSMLKAGFGIQSLGFIAFRWKKNLKIIEKYLNKFPNRFFDLKYEDLAKYPETKIKEICDFLNIEFQPGMLEFYKFENSDKLYPKLLMEQVQSSLLKPINTSNIGIWKDKMTDRQVKLCDSIIGRFAEGYGYERKFKSKSIEAILILSIIYLRRSSLQLIGIIIKLLPFSIRQKIKSRKSIFS